MKLIYIYTKFSLAIITCYIASCDVCNGNMSKNGMFMENLSISNSELCAYSKLLEKLQSKIYLLTLGLEFPKLIWLWQSLWPRFLWRLREQWFGSKLQNWTTVACILDRMFVIPSIHMLVETSTLNKIIFDKKTSRNNKAFIRLWTWGYDGKICVLIIKGTA